MLLHLYHLVTQHCGLFEIQLRGGAAHPLLQFFGGLLQLVRVHGLEVFLQSRALRRLHDLADADHLLQNNMIAEAEEAFKQAIMKSDNSPAILLRIIVSLYDNRYLHACYQMLLKFFQLVKEYYPEYTMQPMAREAAI